MRLAQHDDMVHALATDLSKRILPRRAPPIAAERGVNVVIVSPRCVHLSKGGVELCDAPTSQPVLADQ
jgi:hypothetical protein